jgi:hypothetical protein
VLVTVSITKVGLACNDNILATTLRSDGFTVSPTELQRFAVSPEELQRSDVACGSGLESLLHTMRVSF